MKTTFSILALATSAAATGFLSAGSFNCPGNSDNKCNPELSSGFDFSDLDFGSFTSYKGFQWQGFTCGSFNSKRSRVDRRTGGKGIGGVCSSDKGKSPSFGYQPGGNDGFSLGSIEVHPEFDCDLEFHYGMGDGSTCKTRSSCSKSGTTVHNNQCAGAHNVTIVYPPQNNKPKPSCTVSVPTMSFSCGSTSTSKARTTSSKPYVATTTSEVKTTKTTEIKSTSTVIKTTTAKTTTAPVETKSTTYKGFQNSTFSTVESSTSAVQTTTSVQSSSSAQSTSYITTSYETTSTVFTTQTKTITSCAETVTNCPAHSTVIVTETIPVTTTVCPVTETRPYTPDTTKSASKPTETLPCPDVVPKCLNTFLFAVSCSDNTDTACYCPNEIFVKSVFDCVFAHGETEEIVSEAIIFVQGLCGAYAPGNPYIIAPTVTSYVTATPTKQPAVYTTITAVVTQTVPCTDASGSIIPSSSSTVTVTETATVPQVGFTTGSSGVGVIPVTTQPQFIPSASAPAVTTTIAAPKSNTTVPSGKPQVTVSGAGRTIGTSFGLGLALAALVAVL